MLAGSAGVLCWQVRFRRETAGRIALATVCLLSASTALWPDTWWLALRTAASPAPPAGGEGALAIDTQGHTWLATNDTYYRIAWNRLDSLTRAVHLLPGWEGRIVRWEAGPPWSPGISAAVELTGPRKLYVLPLNQSAHLPGAGWCRASADTALRVECQSVLDPPGTLVVRWGAMPLFEADRPVAPRGTLPNWHPVRRLTGRLPGGGSYAGRPLTIEARQPILYVLRHLDTGDRRFR